MRKLMLFAAACVAALAGVAAAVTMLTRRADEETDYSF